MHRRKVFRTNQPDTRQKDSTAPEASLFSVSLSDVPFTVPATRIFVQVFCLRYPIAISRVNLCKRKKKEKRKKGEKEKRKKGKKEENTGGKVNRVERLSDWLLLPIVSFAIATLSSVASILFARHVSGSMLAIVFPFPSNLPAGFLWPSIRRLYIKGKRKHRSN